MAIATMQMFGMGDGASTTPGLRRSYSGQSSIELKRAKDASENDVKKARIKINVSGTIYETLASTLRRYPDTLLGDSARRQCYYDARNDCLFFDRCRVTFEAILFYYQSDGCLIRPPDMGMEDFESECQFFGLDEDDIWLMKQREGFVRPPVLKEENNEVADSLRLKLYLFLEFPNSSKLAAMFAIFSMLMIVGSVSMTCVTTLPDIPKDADPTDLKRSPISLSEFAMNVFFGLEFLMKLLTAPKRLKFFTSPMNLIDVLAVFPYFIVFAVDARQISNLAFLKAFRTVRVLRLLRFSKHFETLRVVISILSNSLQDLFTVVFCMLLMSVMWGSLAFYVEDGVATSQFISIPEGMWWAIQTIVCLGYGDVIPVTLPGKIAASAVAAIGALTLTVPLLSIGGRYLTMYCKTFKVAGMLDVDDNNNGNNQNKSKNRKQ